MDGARINDKHTQLSPPLTSLASFVRGHSPKSRTDPFPPLSLPPPPPSYLLLVDAIVLGPVVVAGKTRLLGPTVETPVGSGIRGVVQDGHDAEGVVQAFAPEPALASPGPPEFLRPVGGGVIFPEVQLELLGVDVLKPVDALLKQTLLVRLVAGCLVCCN